MNSRSFLKKIERARKKKNLDVIFIDKLIEKNKKNIYDLIKENYEVLLPSREDDEYGDKRMSIIKFLYEKEELKEFLNSKLSYFLNSLTTAELEVFLFLNKDAIEIINNNIDNIIKETDPNKIAFLYKYKDSLSKEAYEKISEVLENNLEAFTNNLLLQRLVKKDNKEEFESLNFLITKLLKELMTKEKVKVKDIEIYTLGQFSSVLKIGTKVLKIGHKRTYNIPYDEQLLLPLIRFNLESISSIKGVVEVQDFVRTEDLTKYQLYDFYKRLRDKGIICTDIKKGNLGYVDNPTNLELGPELKNLGFEVNKPVKKGNKQGLVLYDLDYVYKEDDPDIKWPNDSQFEYEETYIIDKIKNSPDIPFEEIIKMRYFARVFLKNSEFINNICTEKQKQVLEKYEYKTFLEELGKTK